MRVVTVLHGTFLGKERMYHNVVAVTPKGITPAEILQEGLKQRVILEPLPSNYQIWISYPGERHAECFGLNVVLLVIP